MGSRFFPRGLFCEHKMKKKIVLEMNQRQAEFLVCSLNHYAMTLRNTLPRCASGQPPPLTQDEQQTESAAKECSALATLIVRQLPKQKADKSTGWFANLLKLNKENED